MMTISELKSKCEQAMSKQIASDDEESISVLCQNDWVRILVVRDQETPEKSRIEVEVSLPSQKDPDSEDEVKQFIRNHIKHLEYLLHLNSQGLTLGVMSRDSLWTAYLELDALPHDSLFQGLIPPSV